MQTIHLDIAHKNIIPVVYAKQGDVGRKFQAVITDDGVPYTISPEAGFSLWYSGSGGEGNYSAIGGRDAFSISGNTVTVELITQMLVPNGGLLCLVLNGANGTQLGFWDIQYTVEAVPGIDSPEAQQYYTALSETAAKAMEAVASVPPILPVSRGGTGASTPEGARAYLGAAPSGLIAGYLRVSSDQELDAYINHFVSTMPDHTQRIYSVIDDYDQYSATQLTIYKGINCDGFQEIFVTRELASSGAVMARKGIVEGETDITFGPWQWINPPMQAGVEYCLFQRCAGLQVYAKTIALGMLSSASPIVKANLMEPVYMILDAKLFFWRSDSTLFDSQAVRFSITSTPNGNTSITIHTDIDLSGYHGYLELRYTK